MSTPFTMTSHPTIPEIPLTSFWVIRIEDEGGFESLRWELAVLLQGFAYVCSRYVFDGGNIEVRLERLDCSAPVDTTSLCIYMQLSYLEHMHVIEIGQSHCFNPVSLAFQAISRLPNAIWQIWSQIWNLWTIPCYNMWKSRAPFSCTGKQFSDRFGHLLWHALPYWSVVKRMRL